MDFREDALRKLETQLAKAEQEREETPTYHNTSWCQLSGEIDELTHLRRDLEEGKFTAPEKGCYLGGRIRALEDYKSILIFGDVDEPERDEVKLGEIVGFIKTEEPTNSVQLKKELYGDRVLVVPDKMCKISEGLLEDILHELVSLNGLFATDFLKVDIARRETNAGRTFFKLDLMDLIEKIEEVLEDEED